MFCSNVQKFCQDVDLHHCERERILFRGYNLLLLFFFFHHSERCLSFDVTALVRNARNAHRKAKGECDKFPKTKIHPT